MKNTLVLIISLLVSNLALASSDSCKDANYITHLSASKIYALKKDDIGIRLILSAKRTKVEDKVRFTNLSENADNPFTILGIEEGDSFKAHPQSLTLVLMTKVNTVLKNKRGCIKFYDVNGDDKVIVYTFDN
jgi:hypothetical protein